MSAARLTWISITLLLPSLTTWGAEVCHTPRTLTTGVTRVVIEDTITKDVEKVDEEKSDGVGFHAYIHPFGGTRTTTTTVLSPVNPPATSVVTQVIEGPVFEDCCTCGDNENAAYQLKIFSKNQDPTRGQKFDKPILVTQGFDAK